MTFSSDLDMAENLWSICMEMSVEMKKKGIEIDLSRLKTCKTILVHCKTDHHADLDELREFYDIINDIQIELFIAAESLGKDFTSKWDNEFKSVNSRKSKYNSALSHSEFVPGMPRDKKWVRIDISSILSLDKIQDIVNECGAKIEKHEKGRVLVTGDKDSLKKVLDAVSDSLKK